MGRDRRSRRPTPAWVRVAAHQAGVVSRRQLLELGCTRGQVGALLDSRRWRGLLPGVYATFDGPVPPVATAWAAVLHGGPAAVLGGSSALWLWGVLDEPPRSVTLCVPARVHVGDASGVRVVRRRNLERQRHPLVSPPRLRVEEAVLDVTDDAADDAWAIEVVLRATQRLVTTPDRLRTALAERSRHRRRALLLELLEEVVDGVRSALERRWLRRVERPHGLPPPERNHREPVPSADGRSTNRYRDLRYRRWGVVIELDGAEAHPAWGKVRDRRRDNAVSVGGDRSLRYGWVEVVTEPCEVALEVALLLRRLGWTGRPRPCGSGCPLALFDERAAEHGVLPDESAR